MTAHAKDGGGCGKMWIAQLGERRSDGRCEELGVMGDREQSVQLGVRRSDGRCEGLGGMGVHGR